MLNKVYIRSFGVFVVVTVVSFLVISHYQKDNIVSKLSDTDISQLDISDAMKAAGTVSKGGKYNLSSESGVDRLQNDLNVVKKQLAALPKPG